MSATTGARRASRRPPTVVERARRLVAVRSSSPGPAPRAGRAGSARRPTSGGRAASRARGRRAASPGRGGAEHVQAVADLDVLDLAQPAVDVQQDVVEHVLVRPFLQPEVVVQLRGLHQRPDLLADRGQLGRVERGDVGVLVEELLEPRDVAVGLGAGHRRDQVVDERGVRAALGLRALARVVDQERVDQRQVAERGVGAARRAHARASCRAATRGCRACRGARSRRRRSRPRPAARRASGRRRGSGATAAGPGRGRSRPGSRRSRAAAAPSARRCPLRMAATTMSPLGRRTARRAPGPSAPRRPRGSRRAACRTSARYVAAGDPDRVAGELLLGQPVGVLPAGLDERVDQRVAVLLGDAREASPRRRSRPPPSP